jgi:hypothetical protein
MNNFGYLGASWGNAANTQRQNSQAWANQYSQNRQQQNQYNLSRRQFGVQKTMDANARNNKMLQFGVNALAGLMQ